MRAACHPAANSKIASPWREGVQVANTKKSTVKKKTARKRVAQAESTASAKSEKPEPASKPGVVQVNRRGGGDRRGTPDRRKRNEPVAVERRKFQRRAKVSRRRQIDPTTCERDYSAAEIEFMGALEEYKRRSGRMFPTCSEILEVLTNLGYRKEPAEAGGDAVVSAGEAAPPSDPSQAAAVEASSAPESPPA